MMKRSVLIIFISIPFGLLRAADLPYAADTLPYTANNAELIANASGASKQETPNSSIALYQIQISKVVKGVPPQGDVVKAVLPKVVDVQNAEQFLNSIVFLKGPLSVERKQQYGLGQEPTLYEVVSGHYGVVPASTPRLANEIASYVTSEPEARIDWAARNVESSDVYLQRSAVFEAKRQVQNPAMVAVLEKALTSKDVAVVAKQDAVQALQSSGNPKAAVTLKVTARDLAAPISLRNLAVEALGSLDDGQQILQEFKASGDPVLAPKADQVLKDKNGNADRTRLRRIEGDLNEKLVTINALCRANTVEAADQLKAVAADPKEDILVRSNAIIGLSQFESGISQSALRGVSDKVSDPALKKLADGLLDK